jgi:ribosomal protein L13E
MLNSMPMQAIRKIIKNNSIDFLHITKNGAGRGFHINELNY